MAILYNSVNVHLVTNWWFVQDIFRLMTSSSQAVLPSVLTFLPLPLGCEFKVKVIFEYQHLFNSVLSWRGGWVLQSGVRLLVWRQRREGGSWGRASDAGTPDACGGTQTGPPGKNRTDCRPSLHIRLWNFHVHLLVRMAIRAIGQTTELPVQVVT